MALMNKGVRMNNDHKVKLANGTEISWEEFSTWSFKRQQSGLIPSLRLGVKQNNPETWHDAMKCKIGRSWGSHTDAHKKHISSIFSKPVMTPNGEFNARKDLVLRVAMEMNWSYATAKTRVVEWFRDYPDRYYYVESCAQSRPKSDELKEKLSKLNSKPIQTPKGVFRNCKLAAQAYGVSSATLYYWVTKSKTDEFYYAA